MTETDFFDKLKQGEFLLKPFSLFKVQTEVSRNQSSPDALIEIGISGSNERYRFCVEFKGQSTPLAIRTAIIQAKTYVRDDEYPMISVPYLSGERLDELEEKQISGVDMCGNGLIVVPNRFYVLRSGFPNLFKDSRSLNNPYRGRSSLVARVILQNRHWAGLSDLVNQIEELGGKLSLPQASKAVKALKDDLIISKTGNAISLRDPSRLLDKLGREWKTPASATTHWLRLQTGVSWAKSLSNSGLKWAVTGESSVKRYTTFAQGGPQRIAVSNLSKAITLLGGTPEQIRNFADVELVETQEDGYYFANKMDDNGIRWASKLQTWLELQAGDTRQQDAASDIRQQILKGLGNSNYA